MGAGEVVEALSLLISNVGFPITCVGVMFYQMEKERDRHSEESAKWVEALDRNTNIMQRLVDKLDR